MFFSVSRTLLKYLIWWQLLMVPAFAVEDWVLVQIRIDIKDSNEKYICLGMIQKDGSGHFAYLNDYKRDSGSGYDPERPGAYDAPFVRLLSTKLRRQALGGCFVFNVPKEDLPLNVLDIPRGSRTDAQEKKVAKDRSARAQIVQKYVHENEAFKKQLGKQAFDYYTKIETPKDHTYPPDELMAMLSEADPTFKPKEWHILKKLTKDISEENEILITKDAKGDFIRKDQDISYTLNKLNSFKDSNQTIQDQENLIKALDSLMSLGLQKQAIKSHLGLTASEGVDSYLLPVTIVLIILIIVLLYLTQWYGWKYKKGERITPEDPKRTYDFIQYLRSSYLIKGEAHQEIFQRLYNNLTDIFATPDREEALPISQLNPAMTNFKVKYKECLTQYKPDANPTTLLGHLDNIASRFDQIKSQVNTLNLEGKSTNESAVLKAQECIILTKKLAGFLKTNDQDPETITTDLQALVNKLEEYGIQNLKDLPGYITNLKASVATEQQNISELKARLGDLGDPSEIDKSVKDIRELIVEVAPKVDCSSIKLASFNDALKTFEEKMLELHRKSSEVFSQNSNGDDSQSESEGSYFNILESLRYGVQQLQTVMMKLQGNTKGTSHDLQKSIDNLVSLRDQIKTLTGEDDHLAQTQKLDYIISQFPPKQKDSSAEANHSASEATAPIKQLEAHLDDTLEKQGAHQNWLSRIKSLMPITCFNEDTNALDSITNYIRATIPFVENLKLHEICVETWRQEYIKLFNALDSLKSIDAVGQSTANTESTSPSHEFATMIQQAQKDSAAYKQILIRLKCTSFEDISTLFNYLDRLAEVARPLGFKIEMSDVDIFKQITRHKDKVFDNKSLAESMSIISEHYIKYEEDHNAYTQLKGIVQEGNLENRSVVSIINSMVKQSREIENVREKYQIKDSISGFLKDTFEASRQEFANEFLSWLEVDSLNRGRIQELLERCKSLNSQQDDDAAFRYLNQLIQMNITLSERFGLTKPSMQEESALMLFEFKDHVSGLLKVEGKTLGELLENIVLKTKNLQTYHKEASAALKYIKLDETKDLPNARILLEQFASAQDQLKKLFNITDMSELKQSATWFVELTEKIAAKLDKRFHIEALNELYQKYLESQKRFNKHKDFIKQVSESAGETEGDVTAVVTYINSLTQKNQQMKMLFDDLAPRFNLDPINYQELARQTRSCFEQLTEIHTEHGASETKRPIEQLQDIEMLLSKTNQNMKRISDITQLDETAAAVWVDDAHKLVQKLAKVLDHGPDLHSLNTTINELRDTYQVVQAMQGTNPTLLEVLDQAKEQQNEIANLNEQLDGYESILDRLPFTQDSSSSTALAAIHDCLNYLSQKYGELESPQALKKHLIDLFNRLKVLPGGENPEGVFGLHDVCEHLTDGQDAENQLRLISDQFEPKKDMTLYQQVSSSVEQNKILESLISLINDKMKPDDAEATAYQQLHLLFIQLKEIWQRYCVGDTSQEKGVAHMVNIIEEKLEERQTLLRDLGIKSNHCKILLTLIDQLKGLDVDTKQFSKASQTIWSDQINKLNNEWRLADQFREWLGISRDASHPVDKIMESFHESAYDSREKLEDTKAADRQIREYINRQLGETDADPKHLDTNIRVHFDRVTTLINVLNPPTEPSSKLGNRLDSAIEYTDKLNTELEQAKRVHELMKTALGGTDTSVTMAKLLCNRNEQYHDILKEAKELYGPIEDSTDLTNRFKLNYQYLGELLKRDKEPVGSGFTSRIQALDKLLTNKNHDLNRSLINITNFQAFTKQLTSLYRTAENATLDDLLSHVSLQVEQERKAMAMLRDIPGAEEMSLINRIETTVKELKSGQRHIKLFFRDQDYSLDEGVRELINEYEKSFALARDFAKAVSFPLHHAKAGELKNFQERIAAEQEGPQWKLRLALCSALPGFERAQKEHPELIPILHLDDIYNGLMNLLTALSTSPTTSLWEDTMSQYFYNQTWGHQLFRAAMIIDRYLVDTSYAALNCAVLLCTKALQEAMMYFEVQVMPISILDDLPEDEEPFVTDYLASPELRKLTEVRDVIKRECERRDEFVVDISAFALEEQGQRRGKASITLVEPKLWGL
jgi:hypothetical protein